MMIHRIYAMALALPLTCGAARAADPTVGDILSALSPKTDALGIATNMHADSLDASNQVGLKAGHRKFMVLPGSQPAGPSIDLNVEFRSGSADLTPQATTTLSKLGMALTSHKLAGYRFRIEGHTDTVGTNQENRRLSLARAERVADFLEHDFGVLPERLMPVGLGEEGLLVPSADQKGEARNRRVHVVNVGS